MLVNWVKHTASAPGTGPATLTNVTGLASLSDQVALGQPFLYEFLDPSTGNPLEGGIGSLSSSNVLSRDYVTNAMVGGVYSTANTPVNLAAASYTVVCSALKQLGMNAFGACHPSAAFRCFIPSPYVPAANTKALIANTPFALPVKIETLRGVASLGVEITTPGGTSANKIRVGIYACMSDGSIGPKLYECGDIDPSTTGMKSASVVGGVNSTANGWAYAVFLSDVGVTIHAGNTSHSQGSPLGMTTATNINGRSTCVAVAAGWTTMPATVTHSTFGTLNAEVPPLLFVYPA